jgi:hypothetical protein
LIVVADGRRSSRLLFVAQHRLRLLALCSLLLQAPPLRPPPPLPLLLCPLRLPLPPLLLRPMTLPPLPLLLCPMTRGLPLPLVRLVRAILLFSTFPEATPLRLRSMPWMMMMVVLQLNDGCRLVSLLLLSVMSRIVMSRTAAKKEAAVRTKVMGKKVRAKGRGREERKERKACDIATYAIEIFLPVKLSSHYAITPATQ